VTRASSRFKRVTSTGLVEIRLLCLSERNITCTRGSAVLQQWLGTALLYSEQQFKHVNVFSRITQVIATVKAKHDVLLLHLKTQICKTSLPFACLDWNDVETSHHVGNVTP
jgi:hypothetical protein